MATKRQSRSQNTRKTLRPRFEPNPREYLIEEHQSATIRIPHATGMTEIVISRCIDGVITIRVPSEYIEVKAHAGYGEKDVAPAFFHTRKTAKKSQSKPH